MHGDVFGGGFVTVKFDHHADTRAVQVRSHGTTRETFEATNTHVLADLADQAFTHIFHGRPETVHGERHGTESGDISRIVLDNTFGDCVGESQKTVVLGDKVGFAIDFNQGSHTAFAMKSHHAFSCHARSGLAGLTAKLDAKDFFSFFKIAFSFRKRLFTLHHGRVGFSAQFSDHACSNCHCHFLILRFVVFTSGGGATAQRITHTLHIVDL